MNSAPFKGLSLHLIYPSPLVVGWVTPHLHLCSKRWWLKNWNCLTFSWKWFILVGKPPKISFFNSIHLFNQSHLIGKIVPTVSFRENASLHSTSLCSTWDSHVQASLLHGTTGTDVACLPFQPRWPWPTNLVEKSPKDLNENWMERNGEGLYIYEIYWLRYGITVQSVLFPMETSFCRISRHHQLLHLTMRLYCFMAPFSTYQYTRHQPSSVTR